MYRISTKKNMMSAFLQNTQNTKYIGTILVDIVGNIISGASCAIVAKEVRYQELRARRRSSTVGCVK
jgi:hypothetical protein